jgi:hypothetical protein
MENDLSTGGTLGLLPSVITSSLTPLSGTHLRCACLNAKICKEIEQEFLSGNNIRDETDLYQEDIAYASGAVMSSVAFLEATINEFFHDFFDKFNNLKINKSNLLIELKSEWDKNEDDFYWRKLEDKYEIVYKEIIGEKLYKKSKTYENFKDIIRIRNLLVHFKLKWQDVINEDNQYKINHIRKKFKENPFREKTGNPYFPDKCLAAGCAEWSIKSSYEFLTMFSNELSNSGIVLLKPFIIEIFKEYYS